MTLRRAQPVDLDPILAIASASPEAPQWQPAAYGSYLTSDPASPNLLRTAIVAVHRDQIKAFAAATVLLDGAQNLCQLDSMAVHPEARRQGIGSALLRALLAWATDNHARHFSLEVRASNAPAIGLYQRLGLRPEGRRPRYYTHPEEDALILGAPVTAVPPTGSFPL
jgi:[ribosomal protein S18]-alanine N-acetyltransferase